MLPTEDMKEYKLGCLGYLFRGRSRIQTHRRVTNISVAESGCSYRGNIDTLTSK